MDVPALRSHLHSGALPAELSPNLRTLGSYAFQRHRTFAASRPATRPISMAVPGDVTTSVRPVAPCCLFSATSERRPLQIRQPRRQRRSGTCETADCRECRPALILPAEMQDGRASRS
jgi:hypothetical protein